MRILYAKCAVNHKIDEREREKLITIDSRLWWEKNEIINENEVFFSLNLINLN